MKIRNIVKNKVEDYRRLGDKKIFRLKKPYSDIRFYLPNRRDGVQKDIIVKKEFYEMVELKLLRKVIGKKEIGSFLDIGCNLGNHTIYFYKVLKAKKGYCFEPQKEIVETLKKNLELNDLSDKTKVFNVAIGDKLTKGSQCNDTKGNMGSMELKEDKNGEYPIEKLSSFKFKEKIDLIKIDVEGFELKVLKSGRELIEKDKPIIFIEVFGKNLKEFYRYLKKINYEIMVKIGGNYIIKHIEELKDE